jgi:hypothetical protein
MDFTHTKLLLKLRMTSFGKYTIVSIQIRRQ